ncbi:uncharacterized protein N7459_006251 [Penicillium hispanicum]|uniref:uncharacterized protein n=1 Tax=Penicillium hispanicum TaxID=1080232 RepID=UPI00254243A2|nr:uncharacterized protein N7459_006251 [Penicillium hispanicum]KAJ5580266.1 hypothetical protein N7459_006251 [Penicillium hispanicum]
MPFNRIAVYGHRGWASSGIFAALVQSGAPIKVLHRPTSDVSSLPAGVAAVQVDVEDQTTLRNALQDVDILISLVGHEGVTRQHALVDAIPHTNVQLFVPSDLAFRCDENGLKVPVNKQKDAVEYAAREAGIPVTIILPGLFAESSLETMLLGVDKYKNRVAFAGDAEHQRLNICTREYIGAAYAVIFAQTPVAQLQNRVIGLSELQPTGAEIVRALEQRNGGPPQIFRHSLDEVDRQMHACLDAGRPLGLAWYGRRVWGSTGYGAVIGSDVWEVEGYKKKTLEDLLPAGGLEAYREQSGPLVEALERTFY